MQCTPVARGWEVDREILKTDEDPSAGNSVNLLRFIL